MPYSNKFDGISIYFQLQPSELIKMSPHLCYQIAQQKLLENQETNIQEKKRNVKQLK